jgi:O-methyltransferase
VTDKLVPGGVIVIDDYHTYGGCQAATNEFLASNPSYKFEDGSNVILRKPG